MYFVLTFLRSCQKNQAAAFPGVKIYSTINYLSSLLLDLDNNFIFKFRMHISRIYNAIIWIVKFVASSLLSYRKRDSNEKSRSMLWPI